MNPSSSLHILLTNDDGHEAPGIRALETALKDNGYRISVLAPSKEQSATGMSMTTRRNMALEEIGDSSWHIDAQPADTVLVGLHHLLVDDPPDLVVSGINFGPNLGVSLHASGTVGAAVTALLHGVPAIAISAGVQFHEYRAEPRHFPSTYDVLEPAAEFTSSVIDALLNSREPADKLLPPGLMLNINYPALPPSAIKGVLHPKVSEGHMLHLLYDRCDQTGQVKPRYHPGVDPQNTEVEEGDVRAHLEGYITISAVKPGWNAPAEEAAQMRERLTGLNS
jgi:5'-nucleotidase